ncbi:hypothetical protein HPB48_000525 [Haemaphysalis longicornis]|uniref:Nuclease HARBI1 n=1 Tax=Haemaphysalis longicornis TaxID=44386 RepID=A0A9J6GVS2_HAELO|nr:hypothetical protein HPB48_000525 [Haemaphysalis longicornis]
MASEFIASYDSWADFARFCLRVDNFMCGDVYRYPSLMIRQLRHRLNPMELYSDDEFSFRYCFSTAAAMKMLEELCLHENSDRRGAPLPPLLKLLIGLRFYGSGAMQTVVGDLVNVSQPTVRNVLWEVTQAVCLRLFPKYVELPNATEGKSLMTRFYQIGRFPGVTGCIGCTHVQIISPGGDCAEVYNFPGMVMVIQLGYTAGYTARGGGSLPTCEGPTPEITTTTSAAAPSAAQAPTSPSAAQAHRSPAATQSAKSPGAVTQQRRVQPPRKRLPPECYGYDV